MRPDEFLRLYREMLRIRMIEEKIAELYGEQEMRCPVHLCIGEEAISVGVSANLLKEDYVLGGHRSHGNYLAKGGDLKRMLAELYGKATGCSKGRGGSMHLVDLSVGFLGSTPIVASTIPIAVGTAFGSVLQREDRVTLVFFGDAAIEEGVFHESLNFASLKKLPIVFVCENNFYSVQSPLSVRQPSHRELFTVAAAHGVETHQGDGNDVMQISDLAHQAVARARRGNGPTFLEFKAYRWREHCGPNYDFDLGYRSEAEFEEWKKRCPVETFEKQLIADGILTNKDLELMKQEITKEIEEAVRFAKESPFPDPETLSEYVYAEA